MAGIGKKIFYGYITILIGILFVFPLVVFAVLSFTISIWFLGLVVFFKGISALRRGLEQWWIGDDRDSPEAIEERKSTAADARRNARSQSESGSQSSASNNTTRSQSNRSNRSNSNVSLSSMPQTLPQLDRDYEGVGGWLIQRDDTNEPNTHAIINNDTDSQASTLSLNRRPDATPPTFRRRSFGASSSGINSPEVLNTPSLPRHSNSTTFSRQHAAASGSPQSYFNNGAAARSTTSINSRRNSRVARAEAWEDGMAD